MNNNKKVVDFTKIKDIKEFMETANERIIDLENALYAILDSYRLDVVKELAADALGENLEVYLEQDVRELDFNGDDIYPDDSFYDPN